MLWVIFHLILVMFLIIDLRYKERGWKSAVFWSILWIGIALAWNGVIYAAKGGASALDFLTAYLLEKSLSIDNLCVFLLIFLSFQVPPSYQRQVLLWGILGAIVLRLGLILVGVGLIQLFRPILYVFGVVVLYSGIRFLLRRSKKTSFKNHWMFKYLEQHIPIVYHFGEGKFWIEEGGKRVWTLLAAVLFLMEGSDLIFAFDSIPAVLSITQDPLIAYTSNACAILGLRSLYFVLTPWIERFHRAKWGLGLILIFVGSKMVLKPFWEISTPLSFLIVVSILIATIFSVRKKT